MSYLMLSLFPLLAAGLVAMLFIVRSRRNKGFLEISPRYRHFFRRLGVRDVADFLALSGETPHIVSGHPDRNVSRITFAEDGQKWSAFLKCEHRVSWRTRLGNAAAGFGFASRSLREVRMLQALERGGLPGPEWLASGEDGLGRAFLLVRAASGMELRAILATETDRRRRCRIARKLGAALARLHTAGFYHPDLYAQHLFLDRADDSIRLLDWQRGCLRSVLSWRDRRRGLATLHATLDDSLATREERLLCLRTYWRKSSLAGISWRTAVQEVESHARRLLTRRHFREKRQPPEPTQAWICLEGEALCVTPALHKRCGENLRDFLPAHSDGDGGGSPVRRRWPALPGSTRALLVQRKQAKSPAKMWPLPRRSAVSPEQRQAALLLRLQRHGIAAPQVLALGQRRTAEGRVESFLLAEPLADTCSLEAWLAYRTRRRTRSAESAQRGLAVRRAGELLRRLHEASCYLDLGPAGCGFAVHRSEGQLEVILDNVDSLTPMRRNRPRRAARDLSRMQQMLRFAGCSRDDIEHFRAGYFDGNAESETSARMISGASQLPPLRRLYEPSLTELNDGNNRRDSLWRRLLFGVRRWQQRTDWPDFAGENWTDRIMDAAITDRFQAKQGRSTGRWIATSSVRPREAGQCLSVYLKRHYRMPWWRGWLATLWPRRNWSPGWQEWRNLDWARQQGLSVPQKVAVAEYVGPWGRLRSFLAIEELAGMLSLQEAIPLAAVRQDARAFRCWKRGLVAEIARLARLLHDRRCFHKDLYLCHFFIADKDTREEPAAGWRGRVHLIDLHRLAHHPLAWRIWQTKDLAELLYSSGIVGVDARDRLAFWRAYRGDGPHLPRWPWLRRLILYRWRRYYRHNARGKTGRESSARLKKALDL